MHEREGLAVPREVFRKGPPKPGIVGFRPAGIKVQAFAANFPGVVFDCSNKIAGYGSIAKLRRHLKSGKPRR